MLKNIRSTLPLKNPTRHSLREFAISATEQVSWAVRQLLWTTALVGVVFGSHSAAGAAEANHGRDLAVRWCAGCHLISPDQKQASADVPSFGAIARTPG